MQSHDLIGRCRGLRIPLIHQEDALLILLTAIIAVQPLPDYPRAPFPLKSYPQLISTRYTAKDGLPDGAISDVRVVGMSLVVNGCGKWFKAMGVKDVRWLELQPADPVIVSPVYPLSRPGFEPKVVSNARARSGETIYVTSLGAYRLRGRNQRPLELPKSYKPNQPVPH